MKRLLILAIATSMALLLAGCVTVNVQKGSSGSTAEGSGSAASTSSDTSTTSTTSSSASASYEASSSSASSSSSSTAPEPSSTSAPTGTAKYDLGSMYYLNVHEGDTGVVADAAAQVINTGDVPIVLGASNIKIFNESGTVIVDESGNGIFTGPSYLRPGDFGFIYTSGPLPLPSGYFPGFDYKLTASTDISACKEVYEYPISNLAISSDSQGVPMVTGTVTNDDTETASLIEITAFFCDNETELLGVASDIVMNLQPGASADFEIDGYGLPVGCTMAVISQYDAIAVGMKY